MQANQESSSPMSTETEGYSQEYQAEGYIRFALYRFASFLAEMHRFQVKRGGFWMLSDADTETKASDAIYRIGWFTPNNERDDCKRDQKRTSSRWPPGRLR